MCGKEVVVMRYGEPEWLGECLEKNHQDCEADNGPFFPKSECVSLEETK